VAGGVASGMMDGVANGVVDGEANGKASGHKDHDNNREDRLSSSITRRTILAINGNYLNLFLITHTV